MEGRQKLTISEWLGGGTLLKPEIFQNRWRTDKDPTQDLATYAVVLKQPLSHVHEKDAASSTVLESDLQSQFGRDMDAISALDPNVKQLALKQLKPVMGKFSTIVAKFVLDSRIMKTAQGRGAGKSNASIIALKTPPPSKPTPKPMYPLNGSDASAIASAKGASAIASAKGYGKNVSVKQRRRPGNNAHIEDKWICPVCKTGVKNCSQSIKQHKESRTHNEVLKNLHFCEKCNIYCDNTPEAIHAHQTSFDHGHQQRLDADMRDGKTLAKRKRLENGGAVIVKRASA